MAEDGMAMAGGYKKEMDGVLCVHFFRRFPVVYSSWRLAASAHVQTLADVNLKHASHGWTIS